MVCNQTERIFSELKVKHQLTCELSEEKLDDHFMMVYDYEGNYIAYDPKNIKHNYEEGRKNGFYAFDFPTYILFLLIHELGHYLDYQNNKNAININSPEEYIQMELNGIQYAKTLIPPQYARQFHDFNMLVIRSYKGKFAEDIVK
jgi:hypothetical protein